MKRIIVSSYGGPEVLELKDDDPPAPGRGQVLVHLRAAGPEPGGQLPQSG